MMNIKRFWMGQALLVLFIQGMSLFAFADTPEEIYYQELKKEYVPQATPEASFSLELALVKDGMYCYDLPLFDAQWRKKGKRILVDPKFKDSAKMFDRPFQVYSEGDFAVIYFPDLKNLGPVFLYKEKKGWVIDRTAIQDKLFYDDHARWVVVGGEYPYFFLLKKIFELEEVKMDDQSLVGYRIKENPKQ